MKEKDLEKCLDNLIIKGLIREAEQDNAEFETALRNMSEEDFLALVYDAAEQPKEIGIFSENDMVFATEEYKEMPSEVSYSISEGLAGYTAEKPRVCASQAKFYMHSATSSGTKGWKIWATAIASVAAILLIVLIPAYREMDSRLCENALLASETYRGQSRGIEISAMQDDEVKTMLPELERQFHVSQEQAETPVLDKVPESDGMDYYTAAVGLEEAGMDLVQAYLKLGKKEQAIEVLHELAANNDNPDFREFCQKMLEILE